MEKSSLEKPSRRKGWGTYHQKSKLLNKVEPRKIEDVASESKNPKFKEDGDSLLYLKIETSSPGNDVCDGCNGSWIYFSSVETRTK